MPQRAATPTHTAAIVDASHTPIPSHETHETHETRMEPIDLTGHAEPSHDPATSRGAPVVAQPSSDPRVHNTRTEPNDNVAVEVQMEVDTEAQEPVAMDVDAVIEETDVPMDMDDDAEKDNTEAEEDTEGQDELQGEGGALPGVAKQREPTPAYRKRPNPARHKKASTLFYGSGRGSKRPASAHGIDCTPTKRVRTANWATNTRARTPGNARGSMTGGAPTARTKGKATATAATTTKHGRGKKMEFRADRVAKPLEHVPQPSEVPGHKRAADGMVEEWVGRLAAFFDVATKPVAEHSDATPSRRAYGDALAGAVEVVDHMKASVPRMKVDVLERTGLYASLRALRKRGVDERWGKEARDVVGAIASVAGEVRRKVMEGKKERLSA